MAKQATLTNVTTGYFSTTAINDNFNNLNTALNNTLSLDGSTPNAMTADLDVNGNNILNIGNIFLDDGSNLANLNNITISSSSPSGGSNGDIWFVV